MKKIGIYKITNPKGKIYIGQSRNIEHRLNDYINVSEWLKEQRKIYNSLKKYGSECHVFEILEECSEDILNEREIYWIKYFDSIKSGLNIRLGGIGGYHSEETKQKIREALTGKKQSKETIEKRTKSLSGLKRSEESKKNISDGKKGKPLTWGEKIKESKLLNRYAPTEETKLKLRNNNIKSVNQFNLNGDLINTYFSAKEAERQIGVNAGSICSCLKGRTKTSGGFIWKYKN